MELFTASSILDNLDMRVSDESFTSDRSWQAQAQGDTTYDEGMTNMQQGADPYGNDNSAQRGEDAIMEGMGYVEQMNVWNPQNLRYGSNYGIPSHGGN